MKEKKCKICGEMFLPECSSNTICKKDHYTSCPICGKSIIWNSTRQVEPCSKECRKELTKRKNIAKYGVEHPMQSKMVQRNHRQAMMDKYGVASPLQCEEIKQKAIQTNREKFGTDWAFSNKEVKAKCMDTMTERYGAATTLQSSVLRKKVEETCLSKYGVTNAMQSQEVRAKVTNTTFLKYNVSNAMQNPEIAAKSKNTRVEHYGEFWPEEIDKAAKQTFTEHFGVDNPSKSKEIQSKIKQVMIAKYGPDYGSYLTRNASHEVISNINKAFMSKLNEVGVEGEFEFTGINNYRYDIVVPTEKTVIEINPTYTHNAIGNHWSATGLPKDYHRLKTEAARQAGYNCINVFDWDDWDKVISIVVSKTKVYARKCNIFKITKDSADKFLNENHLQGTVKGQTLCLGLVYDDELVQVMTFGSPRYNNNYYSELLRLCTKSGYEVVGGASRLFKFATATMGLENIVSYCDLSKFKGDVYSKIGMKLKTVTAPQEIWSKNDRKITANLLRARGFDQLFNTNYGKGTSNNELMIQDGWLPVYDCGQAVYEYV